MMRRDAGKLWTTFRAGGAPSFLTSSLDTTISIRYGVEDDSITGVQIQDRSQQFWETSVFRRNISGLTDPDLEPVHLLHENLDLLSELGNPAVIIVTSSSSSSFSKQLFNEVYEYIHLNRLAVYIVTFSGSPLLPDLVGLSTYGGLYSVPVGSGELEATSWSILTFNTIFSDIRQKRR